jgi:hypothetical protein
VFTAINKNVGVKAIATFDGSPIPKTIKNSGNIAVTGSDRRNSRGKSRNERNLLENPRSKPTTIPLKTPKLNPIIHLYIVANKSSNMAPV